MAEQLLPCAWCVSISVTVLVVLNERTNEGQTEFSRPPLYIAVFISSMLHVLIFCQGTELGQRYGVNNGSSVSRN